MSRNRAFPSLGSLPTEISEHIYSALPRKSLILLARVSRRLYASVQAPLYRNAEVESFSKLQLFVRTLNTSASFNKYGEGAASKNVMYLTIRIDPHKSETTGGGRPTAVMMGRMVGVVVRYCPKVTITMILERASCNAQPITSFQDESFSRVTTLILNVGVPSLSEAANARSGGSSRRVLGNSANQVIPIARLRHELSNQETVSGCRPSLKFWTGLFNGSSFPHLQTVEIRHLDCKFNHRANMQDVKFGKGDLKGLGKINKLVIESAPELNDSVLMGALQCAETLKVLELKNIWGLSYEALSRLLPHALPNLTHFTLHIPRQNHSAINARRQMESFQPLARISRTNPAPVHLCPLFREFGKNLEFLDLEAPYLCRDFFISTSEQAKLVEAGVKFDFEEDASNVIDRIAIRTVIGEYRRLEEQRRFTDGSDKTSESEKEQKSLDRRRKLDAGNWKRILRVSEGMCRDGDCWEGFTALAEVEEKGIEWIMGHQRLKTAGIYEGGKISQDMSYKELFGKTEGETEEEIAVRSLNRRIDGHDFNDDLAESESL